MRKGEKNGNCLCARFGVSLVGDWAQRPTGCVVPTVGSQVTGPDRSRVPPEVVPTDYSPSSPGKRRVTV